MKIGDNADSSADIAFSLGKSGVNITPIDIPRTTEDLEWSFPDTVDGIKDAIRRGADTIWLNTVFIQWPPN